MPEFEIILFYKYVLIDNPQQLAADQLRLQQSLGLTGRTLVAREGINGTLEGAREHIDRFLEVFLADPRFADVHIKRSVGTGTAFPKASVKVKNEIVALGLSCDIDPNQITGIHLKPEELHQWIKEKKEFYIIDMRNVYEHDIGHFQNSILPPLDNFRDLPKILPLIEHLKNKTVLTVCTGGVRCEKASGFLIANGFTSVYQLDGGIVSYMEKYPNEDFIGKLYVFDNRMMMGFYTDDPKHVVVGKCIVCNEPCERFTNCVNDDCHRQCIACASCQEKEGKNFLCKQGCRIKTRQTEKIPVV